MPIAGKQDVLQKIATGELRQGIGLFVALANASMDINLQHDATLLSGRFARLEREALAEVITREERNIEEARIMSALSAYANRLPEQLVVEFRGIELPGSREKRVTREISPDSPEQGPRISGFKKILFLGANPDQTTQLRINQELRDIENGLERARHRDRFELVAKWAVRPPDLRRALLDESPQIIHFSGHGSGDAGIVLEDDHGQAKLVSSIALGNLFGLFSEHIECVLLNACYSDAQADEIARHIPFVIGMSDALPDPTALEFAVAFYDALGSGRDYPFAFQYACTAIELQGLSGSMIPILKKRTE